MVPDTDVMVAETITLELHGDVSLGDFASTMQQFQKFIQRLSSEIGEDAINWQIDELHAGSAAATIRGSAPDPVVVDKVVRAYHTIGNALATNEPIPYSKEVEQHAQTLTTVINGSITSLHFATDYGEVAIFSEHTQPQPRPVFRRGIVRGKVETVTRRGRWQFKLYDAIFNTAITCYASAELEEQMRSIWNKKVVVDGLVGRNPDTGQAREVRDIRDIHIIEQPPARSFEAARGMLTPLAERPEARIRSLRDAE